MLVGVIDEIQQLAVEGSRLGIPVLFGRDVIHGHRTVSPIPLGLAASFDPELVRRRADMAAARGDRRRHRLDLRADGRPLRGAALGPGRGVLRRGAGARSAGWRPPRSRASRATTRRQPDRIGACAKHFVGYGLSAGGRDYDTVSVGENTLRNLHLRPFRAAVEAACSA